MFLSSGVSTKKIMKMDQKLITLINFLFSLIFFAGCFSFVVVRGYKCILKYGTHPQSNRISYKFNGIVQFPMLSFCPLEEPGLKIDELSECQLSQDDYFSAGKAI